MGGRGTPLRAALWSGSCLVLLGAAIALGLLTGVERIDLATALADPGSVDATILFGTRLTRVLLGACVGAALSPAGVAFQALLRNPLADPFVLGISGGAAVAGTLAMVIVGDGSLLGTWTRPVFAFAGALAAIGVVFALGRARGRLVPNLALLAGVVISVLSSALITAIRVIASPHATHQALYWLSGTLSPVEGSRIVALACYVAVGGAVLYRQAVAMNALALGDEAALSVGIDIDRARRTTFLAASLLTGAAVAFAGPIAFVGIIVPHALRGLVGPDHRILLPASALVGGAFLVLADLGARLSFLWLGTEPTVGVLTALIGAPFFLVILSRRGTERAF